MGPPAAPKASPRQPKHRRQQTAKRPRRGRAGALTGLHQSLTRTIVDVGLIKIMGPWGLCIIVYSLLFRGQKGPIILINSHVDGQVEVRVRHRSQPGCSDLVAESLAAVLARPQTNPLRPAGATGEVAGPGPGPAAPPSPGAGFARTTGGRGPKKKENQVEKEFKRGRASSS